MTTEAPTLVPEDILIDGIETSSLHLACCLEDRFYCKAPFHAECAAGANDDEEECCKPCVDIRYQALCPPHRPSHQHCPFTGRRCPK